MNLEDDHVDNHVVILGFGDIGLITARRLVLEGAKILGVHEVIPYSGGSIRNIMQCLNDYNIPLHLLYTIAEVRGDKCAEQVVVQKVDENRVPIPGTEKILNYDIVLLSIGLIPENELSYQAGFEIDPCTNDPAVYENTETSTPGIFVCGDVVHVHGLVDFVTAESQCAGKSVTLCGKSGSPSGEGILRLKSGSGVGYAVPQKIRPQSVGKPVDVFFHVNQIFRSAWIMVKSGEIHIVSYPREHIAPGEMEKATLPLALLKKAENGEFTVLIEKEGWRMTELICIVCPEGCRLHADERNGYEVTGNSCPRGEVYGKRELIVPTRTITSTVKIGGASIACVPMKTDHEVPKKDISAAMCLLDDITLQTPVYVGDTVAPDFLGFGVNFVITCSLAKVSDVG